MIADRSAAHVASYRFRATFGRRWGGYLTLAVLIGLLGGVAMASLVAARRTDSSYPKFLAGTNPSDLIVQPNGGSGSYQDAVSSSPRLPRFPMCSRRRRPPQSWPQPSRHAAGSAPCSSPRCS